MCKISKLIERRWTQINIFSLNARAKDAAV